MPQRTETAGGFALVLVLWMSLLLAVVAAGLLAEIRNSRLLMTTEVAAVRLRLDVDGGINRAILSLVDTGDPLLWRLDGTPLTVPIGAQPVTVSVSSELGKIDVNACSPSMLYALFLAHGVPANDSQNLADRIVSWRSPAPSLALDPTASIYRDAKRSYGPRHDAFRSLGELRLVLGMTDELQTEVSPLLTVYTNSTNIDMAVANEQVLEFLAKAGNNFAAGQLAARYQGNAAGVNRRPGQGEPLAIEAHATAGSISAQRFAVIRLNPSGSLPYEVISWR